MALTAHDDGTYTSPDGYEPYRVESEAVILSGYYCSFANAVHYRTYGATITVRHHVGGESSGDVLDRARHAEIIAALEAAGIPEYEYNSIHGRMLPKLGPGEYRF